jgi:hypothetical protein
MTDRHTNKIAPPLEESCGPSLFWPGRVCHGALYQQAVGRSISLLTAAFPVLNLWKKPLWIPPQIPLSPPYLPLLLR